MVTSQQWSAAAKLLGNALLDIAAELAGDGEPDLLSPTAQPLDISVSHQIGLGGNGVERGYPECRVCYARGGGGHGGFCPNSGKIPALWIMMPPPGYLQPAYPEDREPW